MPRSKAAAAEEPAEKSAVPSDTEETEEPVEAETSEPEPEFPEPEPEEPENPEPEAEEPENPAPEAEEEGDEIGLNPGEEIVSQRTRDDAVVVAVTNFGRKLEITPEGSVTVVTGPPLTTILPLTPQPKSSEPVPA